MAVILRCSFLYQYPKVEDKCTLNPAARKQLCLSHAHWAHYSLRQFWKFFEVIHFYSTGAISYNAVDKATLIYNMVLKKLKKISRRNTEPIENVIELINLALHRSFIKKTRGLQMYFFYLFNCTLKGFWTLKFEKKIPFSLLNILNVFDFKRQICIGMKDIILFFHFMKKIARCRISIYRGLQTVTQLELRKLPNTLIKCNAVIKCKFCN